MTDIIARAEAALVGVTEGPESTDMLAFHLRNMADGQVDGIDADRLSRAATIIEATTARQLVPDLIAHARGVIAARRVLCGRCTSQRCIDARRLLPKLAAIETFIGGRRDIRRLNIFGLLSTCRHQGNS